MQQKTRGLSRRVTSSEVRRARTVACESVTREGAALPVTPFSICPGPAVAGAANCTGGGGGGEVEGSSRQRPRGQRGQQPAEPMGLSVPYTDKRRRFARAKAGASLVVVEWAGGEPSSIKLEATGGEGGVSGDPPMCHPEGRYPRCAGDTTVCTCRWPRPRTPVYAGVRSGLSQQRPNQCTSV